MTYWEDLKKVSSTSEYLTRSQARRMLAKNPEWNRLLHGDLQMHIVWSGFDAILLKLIHYGRTLACYFAGDPAQNVITALAAPKRGIWNPKDLGSSSNAGDWPLLTQGLVAG